MADKFALLWRAISGVLSEGSTGSRSEPRSWTGAVFRDTKMHEGDIA